MFVEEEEGEHPDSEGKITQARISLMLLEVPKLESYQQTGLSVNGGPVSSLCVFGCGLQRVEGGGWSWRWPPLAGEAGV